MRGISATSRSIVVVAGACTLVALLAACSSSEPMPTPEATSATPSPGASAPAEPTFDPSGTATENLPFFDQVNLATFDAGGRDGRDFIDGLVAAGFAKEAMELTPDRTSINAQADTFQFSVRINGTCLLGQYGGTGYESAAGPLLADGRCLIGTTRPIDW